MRDKDLAVQARKIVDTHGPFECVGHATVIGTCQLCGGTSSSFLVVGPTIKGGHVLRLCIENMCAKLFLGERLWNVELFKMGTVCGLSGGCTNPVLLEDELEVTSITERVMSGLVSAEGKAEILKAKMYLSFDSGDPEWRDKVAGVVRNFDETGRMTFTQFEMIRKYNKNAKHSEDMEIL